MGKRARSCKPTEPDCAPTEIDSESDQDVKDIVVIEDAESIDKDKDIPNSLAPYYHWNSMAAKIMKCVSVSTPGHCILFDVCPPQADIGCHIDFALDKALSLRQHRNHYFKFGVSCAPSNRWTAFPDYKHLETMLLVYTSENSDDTAKLERACIAKYRNDARLQNRSPGGENAHCGTSPHFVYIVLGKPHQFAMGRAAINAISRSLFLNCSKPHKASLAKQKNPTHAIAHKRDSIRNCHRIGSCFFPSHEDKDVDWDRPDKSL